MTDSRNPDDEKTPNIEAAMDLPERPGFCVYMGGYVRDGETVDYFGVKYICRAPRLVPYDG
jgi:hypothetical protein